MCANQLLPHEEDRCHIQGIGHKLVDDHKNDGDIPCSTDRYHTIHITCKSGYQTFSCGYSRLAVSSDECTHGTGSEEIINTNVRPRLICAWMFTENEQRFCITMMHLLTIGFVSCWRCQLDKNGMRH